MKSIHLIEDEWVLGESIVEILVMYEFDLTWSKSVQEFTNFLDQGGQVGLFLCDFHLPDGSLKDVYVKIKDMERMKHVPILACSATASEEDLAFLQINDIPILSKPFTVNQLIQMVSQVGQWNQ